MSNKMYSFQSLINAIDVNDVPFVTTILEEFSLLPDEYRYIVKLEIREALTKAIEKKSLQLLTLLYNSELFTRYTDSEINENLIRNCVSVDFLEGIQFFLPMGEIPQNEENEYYSPSHQCIREDKLEVLKHFEYLMQACRCQSLNVLSYFVNSYQRQSINYLCRRTLHAPLHQCIDTCNTRDVIKSVKILVEAGADINQVYHREKHKPTPIVMAAEIGMPSVVMYLMDHGADIHISARNPNTLLHYLARSGNTSDEMGQCIDKLIKAGVPVDKVNIRNKTPIYLAVHRSNIAVLKSLIQGKCNLNIRCGKKQKSPLSASVTFRNIEATELLLKAGCAIDLINGTGVTPFVEATRKRKVNFMKLLVSHGANVNIKYHLNKATPALPVAVQAGDSDLTEMLLNAGTDSNIKDGNGKTALSIATENNNMPLTEMLLKAGVDANIPDVKGRTHLCLAIENNYVTLIDMLLKAGVDANITDVKGRTPLCIAIVNNHVTLTEMLLKAGVDANITDDKGRTPLCTVIKYYSWTDSDTESTFKDTWACRAFVSNSRFTKINRFAEVRSVNRMNQTKIFEFVKILIEGGANVNQVCQTGECGEETLTPVFMAADKEIHSVVMYLIDHGANLDINTVNQDTLLHYIARSNDTSHEIYQCVDKLIKAGVPVDKFNIRNETPIYLAVHRSNIAVLKALIQGKCNLNIRCGEKQKSPLSASVTLRNTEATELLLKAGCDVDLIDGTGVTLFVEATRTREVDLMKLLVSHGANVNIKNHLYKATSALHVAMQAGDSDLTEMLLNVGADSNIKDGHGCTALHCMHSYGHPLSRQWIHLMKLLMIKGCDTSIECSQSHMRELSHLILKTKSLNLIWFCITDNWYPKSIRDTSLAPTMIFGIEDKLELAKTLYACDFTKSVISSVWSYKWCTPTNQSDDQKLLFHKFICSEDLKSRCRKIIRRCIGSNIKDKIKEIEIPATVKNFILLKDVIPEEYFTLAIDDDSDHSDDVSDRNVSYDHVAFRYYGNSNSDYYGNSNSDYYDNSNSNYDYSDNDYDYQHNVDYFHSGISDYDDYDDYDFLVIDNDWPYYA